MPITAGFSTAEIAFRSWSYYCRLLWLCLYVYDHEYIKVRIRVILTFVSTRLTASASSLFSSLFSLSERVSP